MQEKATLARPYARAAFETAQEAGKLRDWSGFLAYLAAVVIDPLMHKVIQHPGLSDEELSALVIEICGTRAPDKGGNFITVLARAGRLGVAPQIHGQFEDKRADAEGITGVEVITAFELDDAQRDRITEIMKRRIGGDVGISTSVDKQIIGGVIIRAGDAVVDASLQGRLRELGNDLAI